MNTNDNLLWYIIIRHTNVFDICIENLIFRMIISALLLDCNMAANLKKYRIK